MSANQQTVQSRRALLARLPSFFAALQHPQERLRPVTARKHRAKRVAGNEHDAGGNRARIATGGRSNIDIGLKAAAAAAAAAAADARDECKVDLVLQVGNPADEGDLARLLRPRPPAAA